MISQPTNSFCKSSQLPSSRRSGGGTRNSRATDACVRFDDSRVQHTQLFSSACATPPGGSGSRVLEPGIWALGFRARPAAGWPTGLEPATARITIWSSTIELWPPTQVGTLVFGAAIAKAKRARSGTLGRLFSSAVPSGVATRPHMTILRLPLRMKKIGLILLAGFSLSLAPAQLAAQSDDPSEVFLKAYMTSQQGEKLEHDNQFQAALAKFRFAGSLLEELRKAHARLAAGDCRISEPQDRRKHPAGAGQNSARRDLAATIGQSAATGRVAIRPSCRRNPGRAEPSVAGRAPRSWRNSHRAPAPPRRATAPRVAERGRDQRGDQEIAGQSRSAPGRAGKIAEPIRRRRAKEKESAERQACRKRIRSSRRRRANWRKRRARKRKCASQLAQAQDSLKKISRRDRPMTKARKHLRAEIAQLKKALATAEKGRAAAEKEKERSEERSQQLTARDERARSIARRTEERQAGAGTRPGPRDREFRSEEQSSPRRRRPCAKSARTSRRRNRRSPT